MGATAPKDYKWVSREHISAEAPVTRDLVKELSENLHHLYIRITGSDGSGEGINVESGLCGHIHGGGDDGMVMPRAIDTRFQRVVSPQETAEPNYSAVFERYLGNIAKGEWEDLCILPDTSANIAVKPVAFQILASPGIKYIGGRIYYQLVRTDVGSTSGMPAVGTRAGRIRLGAVASGENFAEENYGVGIDLHFTQRNLGDFGEVKTAEFGALFHHLSGDDWEMRALEMPDVSPLTAGDSARLLDINFQVQQIYNSTDDEWLGNLTLIIWGYQLFEAYPYNE